MKPKSLTKCPLIGILLLFIVMLVGYGESSSVGDKIDISNKPLPQQKADLPSFTLFKDSSYENAGTAKVIWHILLSPEITKESLTNLMNDLYIQAQTKKFKEHNQATVISIKAYMSRQHAESGMGQWVAMIIKLGGEDRSSLTLDNRQINQIGKQPEVKFGLSEDNRKEIWQELVHAEDKAEVDAEQQYPEPSPDTNNDDYLKVFDKRNELTKQLRNKYWNELAKKYDLARKQLDEIRHEGLQKSWAFPKRQKVTKQ